MSPIRASEQGRYPKDWPQIRARILARAGGRCEFLMVDGTRCNAPDLTIVHRSDSNPEVWGLGEVAFGQCYQVKVVLTVAHLDHEPENCADENLKCGCQLHHLRHDAKHHQVNAARTRREKKNNGELFA